MRLATCVNLLILMSASSPPDFRPVLLNGLYPGLTRGLSADILATQALSGAGCPVCTTHVAAGQGVVTDVLSVPTDTVDAHLQHLFETEQPTAAKVGILSDAATVEVVFQQLREHLEGPIVYDCTLSGPSGEDLTGPRTVDTIVDHLDVPGLVAVRKTDAELLAGMEIPSLDDAQVAVQRIAQRGAQRVLLRCGRLPTHFFDTQSDPPDYSVDLYYDGDDFALFEAPFLSGLEALHGASSGLLMAALKDLATSMAPEPALQHAKARITEALKAAQNGKSNVRTQTFFDALRHSPLTETIETED